MIISSRNVFFLAPCLLCVNRPNTVRPPGLQNGVMRPLRN